MHSSGVGVGSFSFGGSGVIGSVSWRFSVNGSISSKCTKTCCSKNTLNAGKEVDDENIRISMNALVEFSGASFGNEIKANGVFGYAKGSWWAGLKVAGGISGSVSGNIGSDLCNNIKKQGSVCFEGKGALPFSGGAGVTIQAAWLQLDFGADLTGAGSVTLRRCYICNDGVCGWGKTQMCLSGSVQFNVSAFGINANWLIWENEKCWDL